jgi:tRNA threonylcarbamoyladenosine biosynthesis protein TsaE
MKYELGLHELDLFAQTFWKECKGASVFAFHGEMGAGKTTLIVALCRALGVQDAASSPTFSIINEYADGQGQPVFHMDLYRLNDPEEITQTGVEDTIASGAICLVEWPEKAPYLFDDAAVHVHIAAMENGKRLVEVKAG